MFFTFTLSGRKGPSGRGSQSPQSNARRGTVRPRLEQLEDRLAPAIVMVGPLVDATAAANLLSLHQAIGAADAGSMKGLSAAERALVSGTVDRNASSLGGTGTLAAASAIPTTVAGPQDLWLLVKGKITALSPDKLGFGTVTVATANGPFTFTVTSQTVITIDGKPATYGGLKAGDFCQAVVNPQGDVAIQISASSVLVAS